MNTPKRPSPHDHGAMSATVESLLTAGAVVLMLGSMAFMAMVISTGLAAPQVGDVLMFHRGVQVADSKVVTAREAGQPQASCVLDPTVMARNGGSLVVEGSLQHARLYQVHWAGTRTASGARDCGRSADLILPKADLQRLVIAVGGRGIGGRGYVF